MGIVEIPVFTGSDLRSWLDWMENHFYRCEYNDLEKLWFAHGFIDGEAEAFCRRREALKIFESWKEMRDSLLMIFGDADDSERITLQNEDKQYREQMFARVQNAEIKIQKKTTSNISVELILKDESGEKVVSFSNSLIQCRVDMELTQTGSRISAMDEQLNTTMGRIKNPTQTVKDADLRVVRRPDSLLTQFQVSPSNWEQNGNEIQLGYRSGAENVAIHDNLIPESDLPKFDGTNSCQVKICSSEEVNIDESTSTVEAVIETELVRKTTSPSGEAISVKLGDCHVQNHSSPEIILENDSLPAHDHEKERMKTEMVQVFDHVNELYELSLELHGRFVLKKESVVSGFVDLVQQEEVSSNEEDSHETYGVCDSFIMQDEVDLQSEELHYKCSLSELFGKEEVLHQKELQYCTDNSTLWLCSKESIQLFQLQSDSVIVVDKHDEYRMSDELLLRRNLLHTRRKLRLFHKSWRFKFKKGRHQQVLPRVVLQFIDNHKLTVLGQLSFMLDSWSQRQLALIDINFHMKHKWRSKYLISVSELSFVHLQSSQEKGYEKVINYIGIGLFNLMGLCGMEYLSDILISLTDMLQKEALNFLLDQYMILDTTHLMFQVVAKERRRPFQSMRVTTICEAYSDFFRPSLRASLFSRGDVYKRINTCIKRRKMTELKIHWRAQMVNKVRDSLLMHIKRYSLHVLVQQKRRWKKWYKSMMFKYKQRVLEHMIKGLMKIISVNKLTAAGYRVKLWIADWFEFMNNKLGSDLKKIRVVGEYYEEIFQATMMKCENVEFLWSSDEIKAKGDEYWPLVMDIACKTVSPKYKTVYAYYGQTETEELSAAHILYICMQRADTLFLEADIGQFGMDQQTVNLLERGYCDDTKRGHKPIILSHHILSGLQKGRKRCPRVILHLSSSWKMRRHMSWHHLQIISLRASLFSRGKY